MGKNYEKRKKDFYRNVIYVDDFRIFDFCGCEPFEPNESPMKSYFLGHEYNFEWWGSIKVDHDNLNEQFIVDYKINEADSRHRLKFELYSLGDRWQETLVDGLEYTDENGLEIEFDQDGDYYFEDNIKVYVSYKNASEENKDKIIRGEFELYIGGLNFISKQYPSNIII